MKRTPLALIVLLFLMGNILNSQDIKFGKVSKEELQEKFNPQDSTVAAIFLYKYRSTYFQYGNGNGFELITEVHERIKIYNKDGFDYATKKIKLYKNGSGKEVVNGLKAYTYNLENGKVTDTKIGKDGQFSTALSENWNEESFTMPNLKEGSVIEYKYKIVSPFVSNVDEFVFQHDIPVKRLVAHMDTPEYFNFRMSGKGFLNIVPKTERKSKTLNITQRVKENSKDGYSAGTTKQQRSTLTYISTITSYELNNVPALKEEPYVNGINNYRAGMKYELSFTKFPNSPMKQYATDWEAVVKTIYNSTNFGGELKKTGYFEKDVDALLAAATTDAEKIGMIFNFVKSKVKWDEFYGKYTSDGVKKAYKDGTGNVAEINLMLTAMLRHAGLDANPVLVSTRKNGVPLFPTREGYNYVVSSVQLENGIVLLDATSTYSTGNVLPFRALNWVGRVIKKDGSSSLVNLYPQKKSSTKVFMNTTLTGNGELNGKIRKAYSNHHAVNFRSDYIGNQDSYLEELEQDNGDMEIENFVVKNEKDLGKSVIASYDFHFEEGVDVIGDKIYFSPLLFLATSENPFKSENRQFPVDFGYPSSSNYVCSVNLPEGYTVESLPEPMSIGMPNSLGSFKYEILNKGTTVQLKVTSTINEPIISAEFYATLKEYFKKMIEKTNEKVVLSKV